MFFRLDKGTGYMYSYNPNHPCANKAGKVLEHVFRVWEVFGRLPSKDECVHHVDRNRTNNHISNLRLMTKSDHMKLHWLEDHGVDNCFKDVVCNFCEVSFTTHEKSVKFCSTSCASKSSRKFDISAEELRDLVWSIPTVKVGKMLGVSDVAISKRCKKLGVDKPPRGYWAKVKYGKTDDLQN